MGVEEYRISWGEREECLEYASGLCEGKQMETPMVAAQKKVGPMV